MAAIATQESRGSGGYDAVGNKTRHGYAWGKYQVMGDNVKAWSKKHLGVAISHDEFLNTPRYQRAIVGLEITELLEDYRPSLVAKVWFAGNVNASPTKTDVNGKTVGNYVVGVMANY
jgi:hypothetical protein